jgi:hypothetical protein
MPPYLLNQYSLFQLSTVYHGPKKNLEIKEINGPEVSERMSSENGL